MSSMKSSSFYDLGDRFERPWRIGIYVCLVGLCKQLVKDFDSRLIDLNGQPSSTSETLTLVTLTTLVRYRYDCKKAYK